MLQAGFPPMCAEARSHAAPLAAWHGNAEMVQAILAYTLPRTDRRRVLGTPLVGHHGSENGWHWQNWNYAATVEALIQRAQKRPEKNRGPQRQKDPGAIGAKD